MSGSTSRRRRRTNKSAKEVEAALLRHMGNVTFAADELGIGAGSLHKRIRENEDLQEAKRLGEAALIDGSARVVAHQALSLKDWKAAKFILERKGRDQGWGSNNKLTQDDLEYLIKELVANSGSHSSAIQKLASALNVELPGERENEPQASDQALRGCEQRARQAPNFDWAPYQGIYKDLHRHGHFGIFASLRRL